MTANYPEIIQDTEQKMSTCLSYIPFYPLVLFLQRGVCVFQIPAIRWHTVIGPSGYGKVQGHDPCAAPPQLSPASVFLAPCHSCCTYTHWDSVMSQLCTPYASYSVCQISHVKESKRVENSRKKMCLTWKNTYCYSKNTVCYLLVARAVKLQSNHCLKNHRIMGLITLLFLRRHQKKHLKVHNSNICKHLKFQALHLKTFGCCTGLHCLSPVSEMKT